MSASREKQNRQEQASSGWVNPKTTREAQQRKEQKRTSILYGIIAVVFVAVAIAAVIYRSNLIPKMSTAAVIGGEKYSAAEVDFYYQNAYSSFMSNQNISYMIGYLGLNTSAPLKQQTVSEEAAGILATLGYSDAEKDQTWYDFFLTQALNQMAAVQAGLNAAQAENFVYPAGVQAQYDDSMASLKTAAQASGLSVNAYLANNFGPLITEKIYSQQILRMLQFDAYANAYAGSLTYPADKLESTYNENPNAYDKATYECVTFSGTAPSTTDEDGNTVEPTEEEAVAAQEAAKAAAEEMLASFQSGIGLEALANANELASYSDVNGGSYSGNVVTEWVFHPDRTAGDAAVLESGTTYYVVVFYDHYREEYETIDIRHILIQPEAGTLSAEDEGYEAEQAQLKSAAATKANELLAQWQAGEATEESFAALAMQESSDTSKYDGGLYTRVAQGQMV